MGEFPYSVISDEADSFASLRGAGAEALAGEWMEGGGVGVT